MWVLSAVGGDAIDNGRRKRKELTKDRRGRQWKCMSDDAWVGMSSQQMERVC